MNALTRHTAKWREAPEIDVHHAMGVVEPESV